MELIGKVTSTKMQKTVVVTVERVVVHPLYKKRTTRSKNYKVHNELRVKLGDTVKIRTAPPISKDKNFKIVEVLKK